MTLSRVLPLGRCLADSAPSTRGVIIIRVIHSGSRLKTCQQLPPTITVRLTSICSQETAKPSVTHQASPITRYRELCRKAVGRGCVLLSGSTSYDRWKPKALLFKTIIASHVMYPTRYKGPRFNTDILIHSRKFLGLDHMNFFQAQFRTPFNIHTSPLATALPTLTTSMSPG